MGASSVFVTTAAASLGCSTKTPDPGNIGGSRYASLEHATVSTPDQAAAARAGHVIQNVFVVVLENHDWSEIEGNPSAPYINDVLLKNGAHATHYFDNPAGAHPSEPNYIWLEAGDNLGITDDDEPDLNHRSTKMHLTSLLNDADVSWKSYQEGVFGKDCPIESFELYAPKHNPMVFFDDILSDSSGCISHVRPFAELATDLANDTVPAYSFITPNLCDDMHGATGCSQSGISGEINMGDNWLKSEMPRILAYANAHNSVVYLTWDEGSTDQKTAFLAFSPHIKTGPIATAYTHSSLVKSIAEQLNVTPPSVVSGATDFTDMFETGYFK